MWFVNLCKLTRLDEGEVTVYHVRGVPDIFTHVGRPSGEMQEIWLSENTLVSRFSLTRFGSDRFWFGLFGLENIKPNYVIIDFVLVWIGFSSVGSV